MNLQKIEHEVSFDQLAGFDNYRQWIEPLVPLLESGDPLAPRGALLAGMPGTGKASCVLATGKLIGRPVLRYHPEGSNAADVITELGVDPVLLWIDEPDESCIELLRLLVLQPEIEDKVLVMVTTSKPHTLPATFTGAAIFDRIWYLDLPDVSARALLWDCLIRRVGGNPEKYDNVRLAQVSALFSPAEIEAVVRQAHAWVEKPPSEKKILAHIVRRTPCAALQDEETASVRYGHGVLLRACEGHYGYTGELEARTPCHRGVRALLFYLPGHLYFLLRIMGSIRTETITARLQVRPAFPPPASTTSSSESPP